MQLLTFDGFLFQTFQLETGHSARRLVRNDRMAANPTTANRAMHSGLFHHFPKLLPGEAKENIMTQRGYKLLRHAHCMHSGIGDVACHSRHLRHSHRLSCESAWNNAFQAFQHQDTEFRLCAARMSLPCSALLSCTLCSDALAVSSDP